MGRERGVVCGGLFGLRAGWGRGGFVGRCCGAAGRVVGECVRMDLTWGFGVGKVRCCKLV
jgi:hypothetical protein